MARIFNTTISGHFKNAYLKAMGEGRQPNPEFSFPASWPDVNKKRYFENGQSMYQTLGIERVDDKTREEFRKRGTGFFGAPQVKATDYHTARCPVTVKSTLKS